MPQGKHTILGLKLWKVIFFLFFQVNFGKSAKCRQKKKKDQKTKFIQRHAIKIHCTHLQCKHEKYAQKQLNDKSFGEQEREREREWTVPMRFWNASLKTTFFVVPFWNERLKWIRIFSLFQFSSSFSMISCILIGFLSTFANAHCRIRTKNALNFLIFHCSYQFVYLNNIDFCYLYQSFRLLFHLNF